MSLRMSADEALDSLFKCNFWLWIKAPVLLYLAWVFFLPGLWKVALLLFASVACAFVWPCVVDPAVTNFHLWFMMITHGAVIYLVFWYTAYAFGYLQRSGVRNRVLGAAGILILPFVLLVAAIGIGFAGTLLGVPYEPFWAFFDRWTPVQTWKVVPKHSSANLDAVVRGKRSEEVWKTLKDDVKHLECLHRKVSVMRERLSEATGPIDLVRYYPMWVKELAHCADRYVVDQQHAERLREVLAAKMAIILGEETSSYLTLQRLYGSPTKGEGRGREERDWIDKWRAFAIVGIAGTAEVLPTAE